MHSHETRAQKALAPFAVALYQPEIPPNTGNIARLCAATETPLHLIRPLGFRLDDRYLKRAGLDYWPHVNLSVWDSMDDYLEAHLRSSKNIYFGAQGTRLYSLAFQSGDHLVFGPETRGLPAEILDADDSIIARVPIWGMVRSLNLSTTVGIVLYEGFRQLNLSALR